MNDITPNRASVLASLLDERYSCRGYLPQSVPRATIDRILALAQRTASWCNSQPWQAHVLSAAATRRTREELLAHVATHEPQPDLQFPEAYVGLSLERRRECGWQLYQATGVVRGDKPGADRQRLENFRFFGAPHVAIITSDAPLGTYGTIDCGAYVANFMLAARALGVASIAQAALASHSAFWRQQLSLVNDRKVVCGISFGYEDSTHPANSFRTSRAPASQVVHWVD
ncbi:nitroreductase [Variovorax sp. WS11]|uniref:nitroreductase n=1 Tax=Variovorax sp. WS11 TaxID=1105204 RepID=UPI000D0D5322|nr:nitroreductase [Variovorax sp. WS11]NDZ18909.1 nitroreductase [Variovorax sp. WS11]PSL82422.1 nitroreductase [Variovorax sp. WS11]